MNTMIENIKGLMPLLAVVAALGGFYYTTQHRLDHLEGEVEALSDTVSELNDNMDQVGRQVSKIERKMNR
tara:strand:+ start:219 stop:428 length:210 start_codon:yes stop_codon:yes gene_type:complete